MKKVSLREVKISQAFVIYVTKLLFDFITFILYNYAEYREVKGG